MPAFPMRFLWLSSLCCLCACTSVYKGAREMIPPGNCLDQFRPRFSKVLYTTSVDVVGKHLSGILLIKQMPDSSTRIVFSNEMGFKYFDLEFAADGAFKAYYVLKQMDKKSVLTTLRKDFELLLMQHLDSSRAFLLHKNGLLYYGFPQEKGNNYYVVDSSCQQLIRAERASDRKTVVTATMQGYQAGMPDTIGIRHEQFAFTISLKKLQE